MKNKCINCSEETENRKFCSRSCSATYNNKDKPKRIKRSLPLCLQCGKICNSLASKFCSTECNALYRWKNDTVPRIEGGLCKHYSTTIFKKYLIEKHGNFCSECHLPPEWNGQPLTLQVDHIDGDSDNNYPINLRLLCPNCHTQTDTFGSKGKGSRYRKTSTRNKYLREYKE